VNPAAVHTAFFFSTAGSVHRATSSGTWGDPRPSTADTGERFLQAAVRSTLAVLDNVERTFAAMPARR
jgi:creatinine amidohydrolase/Fe(II)-dependent formamide hydrolase-like protein